MSCLFITRAEKGFTLLELLLAIVIIAMVFGVLSTELFGTVSTTHVRELFSQARTLDASARLYAMSDGPVTLSVVDGRLMLASESSLLRAVDPGVGVHVMLRVAQGGERVQFDRQGESPDYEIVVSAGDGKAGTLKVHGLTGLCREGVVSQ